MSYSIPGISSPGPCSADTQPIARPHPATRSRRSAEAGDLAGSAAGDRDQTAHRSSRFTRLGAQRAFQLRLSVDGAGLAGMEVSQVIALRGPGGPGSLTD